MALTTVRKDLDETDGVLDLMTDDDRQSFTERANANGLRSSADALLKSLKRDIAKAKKAGEDISDLEF